MITATISEVHSHMRELLAKVQAGESLIITDCTKPVARVDRIIQNESDSCMLPAKQDWNPQAILALPILPSDILTSEGEREEGEEKQ
jgi:antitoxin (DNA-binding transcriptional repressor) of toxin-antitoxin stability system